MADDECSERLRNSYRNSIEKTKYQMANIEYHKQISKSKKRSEMLVRFLLRANNHSVVVLLAGLLRLECRFWCLTNVF